MKAVQIKGYGGPEMVVLGEALAVDPAPGQVRVRVAAAGLNPVDWKIREGQMRDALPPHFPMTIGAELAGIVEAVGSGVTGFTVGDEVHGGTGAIGAMAEVALVDASALAIKPREMTMTIAAALPVGVATANAALDAGSVRRGSRLLVQAAAGGVGHIAVQLARERGAAVTALASRANFEFLEALGVDRIIDRNAPPSTGAGEYDAVIAAFGVSAGDGIWHYLRSCGTLVTLLPPAPEQIEARVGARVVFALGTPIGADLAAADALVIAGKLRPVIARTVGIDDVVDALAEVEAGKVRGKIVVTF
jgi:NADPH:quinone reductase-like Zn-dependent oxidoreductase